MSEGRLSGQTVVVTGAGRGLGRTAAMGLAREGASLWICARTASELERTDRQIRDTGGRVESRTVDVADWEAVRAFAGEVLAASGKVDVLINNAAVLLLKRIEELSPHEWSRTLAVNLTAPFQLTKSFLQGMRHGGGSVVNVSSRAGVMGFADESAYCASKFGLEGLTRALAVELAGAPVSVNTLTPGLRIKPTSMTETEYEATPLERRGQWSDPDVLVPAFVLLARLRGEVSGFRFHAERLSRAVVNEGLDMSPDRIKGLAE